MNLKNFNKRLKKEYNDTFNSEEIELIAKQRKSFITKTAIFAAIGVFICFMFIQHIVISVYNNNVINQEQQMIENEPNSLYQVESYDDFKAKLKQRKVTKKKSLLSILFDGGLFSCGCTSSDMNGSSAPTNEALMNSYDTNVQTAGVDEADVAKCDGKYIYSLVGGRLCVASLDGNVFIKSDVYDMTEIYIYKDYIICLAHDLISLYQIDNQKIVIVKEIAMEEDIIDTRLANGILYFITRDYISNDNIDSCYYDGSVNAGSIYKIQSFNLETFESKKIEVISTYNAVLYMSNDNIYLASNNTYYNYKRTYITIVNLQLEEVGVIRVNGIILNQFSMDEYDGNLRVVTINTKNDPEEVNALYIYSLDTLELKGSITRGIGIGMQEVKSSTFNGDVCYIVTYLTQDPLYEINCSDPTRPHIVSQYEAPGYSSYLKSFKLDEQLYTIGTGYTDDGNIKMSLYKQNGNGTIQIGRDLIFVNSDMDIYKENDYYYSSDRYLAVENLLSHKSLFVYNDSEYYYIGAMITSKIYTIFKVDVENKIKPISIYKEILVGNNDDYRGFLVDGKFYILTLDGLNITEWN